LLLSGERRIPEIKIVLYIIFTVFLFVVDDLKIYFLLLVLLCALFTRLPFKSVKSGWIPITIFLCFTFLSNVLGRQGKILFSSGAFVITQEGVDIASLRTLRVLLMIGGAKVLMSSAKTDDVINGLGRLLGPLEKLGLPVKDFFHTMGLTMKCFPVLKEMAAETYREKVKTSSANGFWEKARVVASFLMPMFVESIQSPEVFFERAEKNEK
jgi:energy-coupling factor transport system permease protein